MESHGIVYDKLNKEWKSTSRQVFGGEVGELKDYQEWLTGLNNPSFVKRSSISGVETVFTSSEFSECSKFIAMDEVDFNRKFEPLKINEIKDIDSILEALRERFYYCGNIVLGNSKFIEKSSNVSDSFFVYDSVKISDCKNIAYSQYLRLCENIFGTNEGGESKFCIRCAILFKNNRSFELWKSTNCSDCYYSFGLDACKEALFSFNVIGRNYIIGNLTLSKDKYHEIKTKLLAEMREKLILDKRLPSLVEITLQADFYHSKVAAIIKNHSEQESTNKKIIEDSFSRVTAVVFGKQLEGGIDSYSQWLQSHTVVPYQVESVLSKCAVQISEWPGLSQLPKNRLVTIDEALKISNLTISQKEVESISLENVPSLLGRIAYYAPETMTGTNSNLINCQWGSSAVNCYKSVICVYSKNCAFCSWPRSSEYCFGCGIAFDCNFSMKCYDSVKLSRCFEVDGGRDCAETYFSHNVEGLQNAAFCFNVKNKRHAVGNAEVGKERFLDVKRFIQDWAYEELRKKKKLGLSIYAL